MYQLVISQGVGPPVPPLDPSMESHWIWVLIALASNQGSDVSTQSEPRIRHSNNQSMDIGERPGQTSGILSHHAYIKSDISPIILWVSLFY